MSCPASCLSQEQAWGSNHPHGEPAECSLQSSCPPFLTSTWVFHTNQLSPVWRLSGSESDTVQLFSFLQVSPGFPISLVMTYLAATVPVGVYHLCVSPSWSFFLKFFYLLIMLLQLSHFPPNSTPSCPPPSLPHSPPPIVHVHGSYL